MEEQIYKAVWNDDEDGLLYGISLIQKPANKYSFIELSEDQKETIKLKVENKLKKQLACVVLVPEQRIPRFTEERGNFSVYFDAETIEKLAHNFLTQEGFNKNNWFNHDQKEKINSSVVVESWVISDETKDKAFALGFSDLPVGTWCIIMKLNDSDWAEYIETGKATGVSIDSYLSMEKMLFSEESSISINIKNSMGNYLKQFIKFMADKEEIKMLSIPQGEGAEPLEVEALEVGMKVTRGEEVITDSEFVFEGMTYKTDGEGMISEMEAVEVEEVDTKKEMSMEDQEKELLEMIAKDPDMDKILAKKYNMSDEEKIKLVLNMAENSKDVKSKFEKLFLEEIKSLKSSAEAKDKEILALKTQLEDTPNAGKIKAEVNLKANNKESTLEALGRISRSNK
jgi:hypothetical protein